MLNLIETSRVVLKISHGKATVQSILDRVTANMTTANMTFAKNQGISPLIIFFSSTPLLFPFELSG
jgi:hypothetical protein